MAEENVGPLGPAAGPLQVLFKCTDKCDIFDHYNCFVL